MVTYTTRRDAILAEPSLDTVRVPHPDIPSPRVMIAGRGPYWLLGAGRRRVPSTRFCRHGAGGCRGLRIGRCASIADEMIHNVDGETRDVGAVGAAPHSRRPVGRHYALVVGVDHYPAWPPPLVGASVDARAFAGWALRSGGVTSDHLALLVGDSARAGFPTQMDFDRALADLVRIERAANPSTAGARLYVALAGHGVTPDQGSGALLFPGSDELVSDNASLSDYLEWLDSCRDFDEVIVVMDCCRSRHPGATGGTPKLLRCERGVVSSQRLLVLFGCEPGGVSFESVLPRSADRRGHLSRAVLEGLEGGAVDPAGGDVTTDRLVDFVTRRVEELSGSAQVVEPLRRGAGFSIVRLHDPISVPPVAFGRLSVTATRAPLGVVSAHPLGPGPTLSACGRLDVDVAAGIYTVRIRIGPTELSETVEVRPGGQTRREYPVVPDSVAPIYDSPTSHEYHEAAAEAASQRARRFLTPPNADVGAIVVVVRTPAGLTHAPMPLDRIELRPEWRAPFGAPPRLNWSSGPEWGPPDDQAFWSAVEVASGRYTLAIDVPRGRRGEALVVPVWRGWQTLVFVPSDSGEVSLGGAALDTVAADTSWNSASLEAALTVQVAAALSRGVTVNGADLAAALGERPGILHRLLLANLAVEWAADLDAERFGVNLVAALAAEMPFDPDVLALRWRLATRAGESTRFVESLGVWRVEHPPLLAHSIPALLGLEAHRPGTISGPASDVISNRLPTNLWALWSSPDLATLYHRPWIDDTFAPDVWAELLLTYEQHRRRGETRTRPSWAPLSPAARSIARFADALDRTATLADFDIRDLIHQLGLSAISLQAGLDELVRGY